jgi:hypothetical protein
MTLPVYTQIITIPAKKPPVRIDATARSGIHINKPGEAKSLSPFVFSNHYCLLTSHCLTKPCN